MALMTRDDSSMAAHLLVSGFLWPLLQTTLALGDHRFHQAPQYPAHGDATVRGCGEYSNQVLANGKCKIIATLPQQDGHRCPDIFRCTHEVSYWRHENEKRKQDILEMKELIAELQEELRNHRHRLRILEHQPEVGSYNSSLGHRVQSLEIWAGESSTLQRLQATFIYDIQAQVRNLSLMLDGATWNSTCPGPKELGAQRPPPAAMKLPKPCHSDCSSLYHNGIRSSGVYTILPSSGGSPVEVFCDMDTQGGGWTMIQRRRDGSTGFNRTWKEYKEGFGDLNGEFWLGNENIHKITSRGGCSLRIDMEDWDGEHKYALYREFSLEDETNYYRLHVSGPSGTAEDSFAWYHNKRSFSTPGSGHLCADISHAGWWYHQCFYSNLNGVYYVGGKYVKSREAMGPDGIVWYSWRNTDYYSLKKVSMMIRPRTFQLHSSP
ncbi:fibrinogen-like protein 1 [Hyla sarda]|uniref:fibrinogen-like protein 1 n=1 Tax=Hyla sarda TaxID=327740 RepID=UPI0024C395C9|nr:fibrinogen-like protein 1 [Hyla sarda]